MSSFFTEPESALQEERLPSGCLVTSSGELVAPGGNKETRIKQTLSAGGKVFIVIMTSQGLQQGSHLFFFFNTEEAVHLGLNTSLSVSSSENRNRVCTVILQMCPYI